MATKSVTKITPLFDNVLVKPLEEETKTPSRQNHGRGSRRNDR